MIGSTKSTNLGISSTAMAEAGMPPTPPGAASTVASASVTLATRLPPGGNANASSASKSTNATGGAAPRTNSSLSSGSATSAATPPHRTTAATANSDARLDPPLDASPGLAPPSGANATANSESGSGSSSDSAVTTVVGVFCAVVFLLLLALALTCRSRAKAAERERVLTDLATERRKTLAKTSGAAGPHRARGGGGGGGRGATAVNPAFAAQGVDGSEDYEDMQQHATGADVPDYLVPGSPAFQAAAAAASPVALPEYDVLEDPAAAVVDDPYLVLEGGKKTYGGVGDDTAA